MILYWPRPSVTAVRTFSISAGLAASTVTPGTRAPVVSLATPAMVPVCASAAAWPSPTYARAAATPILPNLLMLSSTPHAARNPGGHLTGLRLGQLLRNDDVDWRFRRFGCRIHPVGRRPYRPSGLRPPCARGRGRAQHSRAGVGPAAPGRLRLSSGQRRPGGAAAPAPGAVRRHRARPDASPCRRHHHLPDDPPAG